MSGEKRDGREIIERAAQRYINAGIPRDQAFSIATQARKTNEARGDVPRGDHKAHMRELERRQR